MHRAQKSEKDGHGSVGVGSASVEKNPDEERTRANDKAAFGVSSFTLSTEADKQ